MQQIYRITNIHLQPIYDYAYIQHSITITIIPGYYHAQRKIILESKHFQGFQLQKKLMFPH